MCEKIEITIINGFNSILCAFESTILSVCVWTVYVLIWPRYQWRRESINMYVRYTAMLFMYAVTEITSVIEDWRMKQRFAENEEKKKLDWYSIHFHSDYTSKTKFYYTSL